MQKAEYRPMADEIKGEKLPYPAFDIPNLYTCDNSIFSSTLSVNPALTIMALS